MMQKKKNLVLRKLAVLALMLAMVLATAAPALAQGAAGAVNGTLSANQQEGGPGTATDPSDKVTLSFELTVEGEPPAGATFLGFTTLESLMTTPLTDPDGDGTYTGSMTVPKFAPGGPPEPISLSTVRIVQGPPTGSTANGPEYRVIKDFGSVKLDGDKTFSASVSFEGDGGSDNNDDGSDNNGGSNSGGSNNGGSGSSDSGSSGSGSSSGGSSGGGGLASGLRGALPTTGGSMALTLLGVGVLLVSSGLLVRRIFR